MSQKHRPRSATRRTRSVKRMRLDQLRPHWLLDELFDPVPEEKIAAVARVMAGGQPPPDQVEVEPGGTVLYGALYVEAARRAGLAELEVTVREGLGAAPPEAIQVELIDLH